MATTNQQRETEAILTSVRRLVSEEISNANTGSVVERLLLTPAFRVDGPSTRPSKPRREPTPLEQRIAELERAVGSRPSDWEPDGSELVDNETPKRFVLEDTTSTAAPATAPATVSLAPLNPVAHEPAANEAEPTPPSGRSFDATEVDEEQLRDIVAEMVRAELRGVLGERITRNVRKLVRREIHRALLTRDLD
ncbi:MAG: hypothetical protein AAGB18_08905 [Pseudomonadota bacterium]